MPGPFTFPVAEATPFDNETNGFTSEDVQSAIEEARDTAPGTSTRFDAMCGKTGVISNKWLEFFDSIPSDDVPFVMAEPGQIKSLSIGVRISTTATITVYKNGVALETLTITASTKAAKNGLSYPLLALDEISVKVTSGTVRDPIFHNFIQVNN